MFAFKNQQTTVAPVKNHHIGVRRKHAMKKSVAASQPVTTHKHTHIKRNRQMAPKLSLFQRIKLAIMTRLRGFKRPMIAAAPVNEGVTGRKHHHIKRHNL